MKIFNMIMIIAAVIVLFIMSLMMEEEDVEVYEVEAEVIENDYKTWYASGHHYSADLVVYCEKFNLEQSFFLAFDDARKVEKYKAGDKIKVEVIIKEDGYKFIGRLLI